MWSVGIIASVGNHQHSKHIYMYKELLHSLGKTLSKVIHVLSSLRCSKSAVGTTTVQMDKNVHL